MGLSVSGGALRLGISCKLSALCAVFVPGVLSGVYREKCGGESGEEPVRHVGRIVHGSIIFILCDFSGRGELLPVFQFLEEIILCIYPLAMRYYSL